MSARWMARQSSDLRFVEILTFFKASTGISSERKLALGRKDDYYLTGYRQQWTRGIFSGMG